MNDNNLNNEKGKGRPKNSPNKVTSDARQLFKDLLQNNLQQLENDFKALKPIERVNATLKLATFILPTLKSIELKEDGTNTSGINPVVISNFNLKDHFKVS